MTASAEVRLREISFGTAVSQQPSVLQSEWVSNTSQQRLAMNRLDIQQHVIDTLGKILVDKSLIQGQEDTLLSELVLDEEDFAVFFADLQDHFNISLPTRTKSEISHLPDHSQYSQLTLQGLVDVILTQMGSRRHNWTLMRLVAKVRQVAERLAGLNVQRTWEMRAGYRVIAPLFSVAISDDRALNTDSAPRTTTFVIIATNGDGLQFRPFDQTQSDTHIVKPFLQFAVHLTPPSGKYSAAYIWTA
jgi:hypothetical protein